MLLLLLLLLLLLHDSLGCKDCCVNTHSLTYLLTYLLLVAFG